MSTSIPIRSLVSEQVGSAARLQAPGLARRARIALDTVRFPTTRGSTPGAALCPVLVHVTPSADGRDALHPQTDTPARQPGPRSSDWAEIVPELGPEPGDLVITKRQWGAFYGTELDLQLRRRGIDTIRTSSAKRKRLAAGPGAAQGWIVAYATSDGNGRGERSGPDTIG